MSEGRTRGGIGDLVATAAAVVVVGVAVARGGRGNETSSGPPVSEGSRSAPGSRQPATTKSGVLGGVDLFQQRHRALAIPIGVVKKFGDDRAGRLAALVAYYGFFSLFPALLALVTILGFVLEGRPGLRADIEESALGQFPVIGDSIGATVSSPLTGNAFALAVGIGGALWAGMGAMQAAQEAMNEVWDVPRTDRPGFLAKRARSLATLLLVALLFVATAFVPRVIDVVFSGRAAQALLVLAAVVLDVVVFAAAFRVLSVAPVAWRRLLPGAAFAGIGYAVLQLVGTVYVTRTLAGAESTYGTFAVVIGLLSWIFLLAQVTMFGAEVNVVLARRLWPRSLFKPATTSDRRSVAAQAEENRLADSEHVDVSFGPRRRG